MAEEASSEGGGGEAASGSGGPAGKGDTKDKKKQIKNEHILIAVGVLTLIVTYFFMKKSSASQAAASSAQPTAQVQSGSPYGANNPSANNYGLEQLAAELQQIQSELVTAQTQPITGTPVPTPDPGTTTPTPTPTPSQPPPGTVLGPGPGTTFLGLPLTKGFGSGASDPYNLGGVNQGSDSYNVYQFPVGWTAQQAANELYQGAATGLSVFEQYNPSVTGGQQVLTGQYDVPNQAGEPVLH